MNSTNHTAALAQVQERQWVDLWLTGNGAYRGKAYLMANRPGDSDTIQVQLHRPVGMVVESHPYSRIRHMKATERSGFRWSR